MPDRPASFAFVLGTGRCGSTLVHEVLARHPGTGFLSNVEDRLPSLRLGGAWNGRLYRSLPPAWSRKGRLRFAPSEGYRALDRQVAPLFSVSARDLHEGDVTPWLERRFRRFFESRAATQRAPVYLHKFTGWPRAGFVRRVFPEARFVHVVRDGRAVASSLLQMPWWPGWQGPERWAWGPLPPAYAGEWEDSGRSFALLAGLAWKLLIDAHAVAREAVPAAQWLEVRYEDVVADPPRRFAELLTFLGLPWNDAFARGLSRYVFAGERREAFRQDLGPGDVRLLTASLAGHLAGFGYDPS